MYVRLAFAVAAFLDPEILIIDEVLAVGDAEFQKKAIGKMQDISREGGRTVLFVSHNMAAIQSLCTRVIVLQNGNLVFNGNTDEGINYYLSLNSSSDSNLLIKDNKERKGKGEIKIIDIKFFDKNEIEIDTLRTGEKVVIKVYFENSVSKIHKKSRLSLGIYNQGKCFILLSTELGANKYMELSENGFIQFNIPKLPLTKSNYCIETYLECDCELQDWIEDAIVFSVEDGVYYDGGVNYPNGWAGKTVLLDYTCSFNSNLKLK